MVSGCTRDMMLERFPSGRPLLHHLLQICQGVHHQGRQEEEGDDGLPGRRRIPSADRPRPLRLLSGHQLQRQELIDHNFQTPRSDYFP